MNSFILVPSSLFTYPSPYQIKNSLFRDKITLGQHVDLHGIAKVWNQELIMEERIGTQSNKRGPRSHEWKGPERGNKPGRRWVFMKRRVPVGL